MGGEGGCRLEGRFNVGRPDQAGLAGHAVEDLVVVCQRPGVGSGGPLSARRCPALDHHHRHPPGHLPNPLEEAAPVSQPLQVAEGHLGLRVVGEPFEVVGDADSRRVAGRDGPADANSGLVGVVEEAGDEVA